MGEPRRILFVLQSVSVGGMETVAIHLAAELARRGRTVAVVIPEGAPFDVLVSLCEAGNVRAIRLTTDARGGYRLLGPRLAQFARLIRRWRPDVVHLNTGGATGGLGVMAVARLLSNAVVVATEHDVPEPAPTRGLRISSRLRDRVRHALIAVSRRNSGLRSQRLPTPLDRYAAIPNGIPIEERDPAGRRSARQHPPAELNLPDGTTTIGSVVRLAEGKGLHDLLRAFARIEASPPPVLLLVGDGPLRDELELLASELGIRQQVRFLGFQRDPRPYRDLMDVFVLAVPAGTGSIALLEAMADGLPTIITFCGPEEAIIHEETGLCGPPNDPVGLAATLQRFVDDPALRERLGRAAGEHIRQHFSIRRVADDHLDVYRTAATGRVPDRLRTDAPPNPRPGAQTCPRR